VCDTILECASNALQHRLLKKNLLKEIFSQDTVPLAVRCFNVACGTVSWDKISFNRFFFSSLCCRALLAHSRMVSYA
jgi:hypothetical protein